MGRLSNKQISPPLHWQEFENLCADLWTIIWNDPNTQKHGRQGQAQHGVDVYGQHNGTGPWKGVQCKGKDGRYNTNPVTEDELRDEVEKAKFFTPPIKEFILATTAPNDIAIQKIAREITEEHKSAGLFSVHVYSWEDILRRLEDHPSIARKYELDRGYSSEELNAKLDLFINQQIEQGESQTKVSNELSSSLASEVVRQLQGILPARDNTPYAAEDLAIGRELDSYRDLVHTKPQTALDLLVSLRERCGESVSKHLRYRLITNIGAAYSALDDLETASSHFLEAMKYAEPDDDKAERNTAYAYLITNETDKAIEHANKAIHLNPDESDGYALLIAASRENEDCHSLEDLAPESMLESPSVAFSIGSAYRQRGESERAIPWFEKACKSENCSLHHKAALGTELLVQVTSKDGAGLEGYLTDDDLQLLERASKLLQSVWDEVLETEQIAAFRWVGNNLCNALLILQRDQEVKAMIPVLEKLIPDLPEFRRLAALYELEYGSEENAIRHLEHVPRGADSDIDLLRVQVLAAIDKSKALEELPSISLDSDDKKRIADSLHVRLISEIEGPEAAISVARDLGKQHPDSPTLLVLIAKQFQKSGDSEKAKDFADKAAEMLHDSSSVTERIQVADCLYGNSLLSKAGTIYLSLLHNYGDSQILRRALICLYQTDQRTNLQKLIEKIPSPIKSLSFYRQISLGLLIRTGELDKAIEEADAYLESNPSDLAIRLNWVGMHERLGNVEKVQEYLSTIDECISDDSFHNISQIPGLFARYGFVKSGLKLSYRLLRENQHLSQAHSAYIGLVLFIKDSEGLLEAHRIDIETAFTLEDNNGNKQAFIIENDCSTNRFPEDISLTHPIAKKAIGKQIGDKIQVDINPHQSEERTVVALLSKYIYMLNKCMADYSVNFPEQSNMWRYDMSGEQEGEYDFSPLFKALDDRSKYASQVVDEYLDKQLPIGFIAQMLGSSPLAVWADFVRANNVVIKCCDGNTIERNAALELANQSSRGLMLEPLALYTVVSLGIQDELKKAFKSIGVTQSSLDLYRRYIEEQRIHPSAGTMSKIGEQYVYDNKSPEQIKEYLDWFGRILKWAEDNCEIISAIGKRDIAPQWVDILKGMDNSFIDSVLAASGSGMLLLSDDHFLRSWAKEHVDVDGIWTQVAMMQCCSQGSLSQAQYSKSLAFLAEAKFNFISVDASSLFQVVKGAGWTVSEDFKGLLSTLGGTHVDVNSAAKVARDFLIIIWSQPVLPQIFPQFTYAVLNALIENHHEIIRDYIQFLANAAHLVPRNLQADYLRSIKDWCDGHFLSF